MRSQRDAYQEVAVANRGSDVEREAVVKVESLRVKLVFRNRSFVCVGLVVRAHTH